MKLILTASFLLTSVAAFSAVAPQKGGSTAATNIDRSMKGVDDGAFDPVEGENPALKRNNNDGVWVEQVRCCLHEEKLTTRIAQCCVLHPESPSST